MIYDDQPQMVQAIKDRLVWADSTADDMLRRAFDAIDREVLIEKVARARSDRHEGNVGLRWTYFADEAEKDLVAAGVIPERP